MSKNYQDDTVAVAVRVEHSLDQDDVFLVFRIVNERFKKRIKNDWTEDIELRIIEKRLVLKK
jgi:aspartate carbamoyltransferase catalytic subunit